MQKDSEKNEDSSDFAKSQRFTGPVLDPKIEILPLKELPWKSFEVLCAGLVEHVHKVKPRLYGESGQNQEGIDFLWQVAGEMGEHFAEAKRYEFIARGKIGKWVNAFLDGKKAKYAEEYILCTAASIRDTKLVDEWTEARKKLEQRGIRAELWDADFIHDVLREAPKLVSRFFSDEIRRRFCVELSFPDRYPTKYPSKNILFGGNHVVIENETCRLDSFLPTEESPNVSAILSFARADLSGTTIAIPGRILVEWIQWTAWARLDEHPPFMPEVFGGKGRFILAAPHARLMLDKTEVEDLRWVLSKAWPYFVERAMSVEKHWRNLRFNKMDDSGSSVVAIGSVRRPLWNLIMDYIRAHDYEAGNSADHIFDGNGTSCIKVYVKDSTKDLEAGYHLLMWAYEKGGIAGRFANDSIALGWSAKNLSHDDGGVWGARHKWDAEFTHEWLFSIFFEKVGKWYAQRMHLQKKPLKRLLEKPSSIDISEYAWSSAILPRREVASASTAKELLSCVHALQSHFCAYSRIAPVTETLTIHVLRSVALLCHARPIQDEHYIRGKLDLGEGELASEVEALINGSRVRPYSGWMDMACRALIACLDDVEVLTKAQIGRLHDELEPVWRRMVEDLLCERFS